MDERGFYLTTAIPYVNAKPHIGHAQEYVIADVLHRYHEIMGERVCFVSGADENALKNVQAAEREGLGVAEFLDKYSSLFRGFFRHMGVKIDVFRRGSDQSQHWPGVQRLWRRCVRSGDIYKKKYIGLYCVGCESFKTETDLINGLCPDHSVAPERIAEENYFFRLSRYRKRLEHLIVSGKLTIVPEKRKREILSFLRQGLEDFSVSRSNLRARGVGVPIPGDLTQKMYVWFDALTIYMTAVGYGYDNRLWRRWWPADVHVIGKDIIRFHAVYWPAILLSAGLPLPKTLLVHGFITSGGRKMSKSIGNVVDPLSIIERYGLDATRYYLLREIPTLDDGDFTVRRFEDLYQSDLAGGLGNLVSRIAKLCATSAYAFSLPPPRTFSEVTSNFIKDYRFDLALSSVWDSIHALDLTLEQTRPWKLSADPLRDLLQRLVDRMRIIAFDLRPFLPGTAKEIENIFAGPLIRAASPLFPRMKP